MNSEDVLKLYSSEQQFEEHTKRILRILLEQWEAEDAGKYSVEYWLVDYFEICDWVLQDFPDNDELFLSVSVTVEDAESHYADIISFPLSYYDSDQRVIQLKEGQRVKKWLEDREGSVLNALKEQARGLGYKMVKEDL